MNANELFDVVVRLALIGMGAYFYLNAKKERNAEQPSMNYFSPTTMMAIGVFMVVVNFILLVVLVV